MQTNLATNTAPKNSNAPSFESLLADAKELGELAGKGKDTQIKFDLKVADGAYLGTLSLDPNKHGSGRDDATLLAEAYVRATQGAVVFDVRADKTRKQVSNVRKCIKVGANPKWGRGQPMQFINEFIEFRQKVRAKDATALKKAPNGRTDKDLDDAHNGLMRLFTAQLKSDTLLSEQTRNSFAFKTEKGEVTEMEKLDAIRKALKKTGDQSLQVKNAYDMITLRISNLVKGVK